MGKGDKKSKRGKIVIGSYGVRRAHKKKNAIVSAPKKEEPKPKPDTEERIVIAQTPPPRKTTKKAAGEVSGEEKPKTPRAKKKSTDSETPIPPETPSTE